MIQKAIIRLAAACVLFPLSISTFAEEPEFQVGFGRDLTLVGLPEETVSKYVPLLKNAVGKRTLWTTGYCNDVSSYLPTFKIMNQGGYETRGFGADTQAGWYAPEAEKTLVEAVAKIVDEANSKVANHSKHALVETFAKWR